MGPVARRLALTLALDPNLALHPILRHILPWPDLDIASGYGNRPYQPLVYNPPQHQR
jgi:hypothetical protein